MSAEEWANTIPNKLKELVEYVRKNMIEAHKVRKFYYDKRHREVEYNVNDKTWIKTHTLSDKDKGIMSKLSQKWIGPYHIFRKLTPVTYEVAEIIESKAKKLSYGKKFSVHVQNMKPYIERPKRLLKEQPQYSEKLIPVPEDYKMKLRSRARVCFLSGKSS